MIHTLALHRQPQPGAVRPAKSFVPIRELPALSREPFHMRSIRPIVALSLLAALSACDDYRSPTSPPRPGNLAPAFGIFDGAHGGGNTRFFFLPPMVSKPAINAEFHPGLRPRIDICEVENGVCKAGPTFKSFSAADVKVSTADKNYHVNWDTKVPDVDPAKTYRIQVLLGDTPIGFADVDPVANGSQLKQVNTNEFIPLVDGRTLPIKFFLGKGVTCETNPNNCAEHTVTSAVGGDFQAADERFWLKFPANVFPAGFEEVTITIERKPVPQGKACHTLHLQGIDSDEDTEPALAAEYEGCYRVTMDRNSDDFVDAGGFRQPVTVAMCLTGIPRTNQLLRIYKSDPQPRGLVALEDANPNVIAGFNESCEGFEPTPTAPTGPIGALQSGVRHFASAVGRMLSPKSLYAIDLGLGGEIGIGGGFSDFGWGIEGRLETRSAQTRTVAPGSSQAFSVAVNGFTHHHEEHPDEENPEEHSHAQPLAGVPIRFDLLLDGTSIASQTVSSVQANSESEALASVNFTVGSAATYVIRATLAHSGRSPVSFDVNVAETANITGTVSPASEAFLANVQLRLVGLSNPEFARSTSTGEGRSYSFENVPAGRYTLSAAAVGFNITRQTVDVAAGANQVVNLVLRALQPNLVISSFTHSPSSPTSADLITFTAVVQNVGSAAAGASHASIDVGGEEVGMVFDVPSLEPNATFVLTRQLALGARAYINNASADVNDEVAESDEEDNGAQDQFTVVVGLTRILTFDFDANDAAIPAGTSIVTRYSPWGITFKKVDGTSNACGIGPQHVYANSDAGGTLDGQVISVCGLNIASDFSEQSMGSIEAHFVGVPSRVCIDAAPVLSETATHVGILRALDAAGNIIATGATAPSVYSVICVRASGIRAVRFAGMGTGFARFDNMRVEY